MRVFISNDKMRILVVEDGKCEVFTLMSDIGSGELAKVETIQVGGKQIAKRRMGRPPKVKNEEAPVRKGPAPRLTEQQREVIIAEYQSGIQTAELAKRFKVSISMIYSICKGYKRQEGEESGGNAGNKPVLFLCEDKDCGEQCKVRDVLPGQVFRPCPKCGGTARRVD